MTIELLKSKTGRTLIESHRGVEAEVPENSWLAIQLGYQLPDRCWCHGVCWDGLKRHRIDGEPLPELEEVLAWSRDVGIILLLDIKNIFRPEGGLTKEVVCVLEPTNTRDNVMLLFIDPELFQTKLTYPELTVRALLSGRLMNYRDHLQSIRADCVSLIYGMFRPEDVEEIHSAGGAVVFGGLWNPNTDLFHSTEIDIFSPGNPVDARKI